MKAFGKANKLFFFFFANKLLILLPVLSRLSKSWSKKAKPYLKCRDAVSKNNDSLNCIINMIMVCCT